VFKLPLAILRVAFCTPSATEFQLFTAAVVADDAERAPTEAVRVPVVFSVLLHNENLHVLAYQTHEI
tara:strand:+ start:267 stop:467 length:201 start_codon:yes stop_codon:yes gene_type:complete